MSQIVEVPPGSGLKRAVSRWEVVGLSVNDVVGSGVYLLPAAAAATLGPMSPWGVVLAGIAVLLVVLCYAEAGGHFDGPGAAYLYAKTAFGEFTGFEVGWMTWLTRVASVASTSAGLALALSVLWPPASAGLGRAVAIVVPLAILTWLNVVGVSTGARTAALLAVGKVVPLLVFIGVGVLYLRSDLLGAPVTLRPEKFGETALLLLFAYAGFENTAAAAGEFKNPKRDVPFALVTQIALVTLLYALTQLVVVGTLPGAGASASPVAESARLFIGGWGGVLLSVGAVVSILGTTSNTVLSGPRYLYALSEAGYGPAAFARVHPRFQTPANAIVFQTLIVIPLALTGSFATLAVLSAIARLVGYASTAAAVPILRRKLPATPFRVPGGATVPVLAVLVCVALAASATWRNLVAGVVAAAAGAVVYRFGRR